MKPDSTPRKRSAWSCLGVLALGVCIFLCVIFWPQSPHQSVRLDDGNVVELLGYSFGKKHELRLRTKSVSLRELIALAHAPVIRAASTQCDDLLLWVRIPHALDLHPGWYPSYTATACGPNGYRYPAGETYPDELKYLVGKPYNSRTYNTGPGSRVVLEQEDIIALPISCFPRRESRFTVEVTQFGGRKPLASFQILNPNPNKTAALVAEKLPASHISGGLQVTLERIEPIVQREYVMKDGQSMMYVPGKEPAGAVPAAGKQGRQRVKLTYSEAGRPTTLWQISELEAKDAAGNATQAIAPAPRWTCRSYYPPCAGEPYRIRVGVHKVYGSEFGADEKWAISDVPLPSGGNRLQINKEFNRDDLHVRLVSIYGMGGIRFSNDLALLQLKVDSTFINPVILVHAEDEKGHTIAGPVEEVNQLWGKGLTDVSPGNISVMHAGSSGDADMRYRSVPLKIPPGVKRIKVFFTLPRIHYFDFIAPACTPARS